jgi:hypothetical protein
MLTANLAPVMGNTLSILLFYALGCLISITFIVAWFFTSFPLHLTKLISFGKTKGAFNNWAEWLNWIRSKSEIVAELFGCPVCFGFWISLLVASIITIVNGLSLWFIPSAALSWPAIVFSAFKLLSR